MTDIEFWDLGNDRGIVRMRNGGLVFIDTRDRSLAAPIRNTVSGSPRLRGFCSGFCDPEGPSSRSVQISAVTP